MLRKKPIYMKTLCLQTKRTQLHLEGKEKELALIKRVKLTQDIEEAHEVVRLLKLAAPVDLKA
jgi:hypothetical protein